VITNTGVEYTDEILGVILPGESSSLTLSEFHDCESEFDDVCMYVCNKKVRTIIRNLTDC
jgi:hypothetical protein